MSGKVTTPPTYVADDPYAASSSKKQPKQRLNVRVRRGLSWVHDIVEGRGRLDLANLNAKTRGDVEAALRWIAENKQ